MSDIGKALEKLYEDERIILWYDDKEELREEFQSLRIEGVTSIEVKNDELGLKYRILRQERDRKFLLYFPYDRPKDEDNWLLDVLLANHQFHTDLSSTVLRDLGLSYDRKALVERHHLFFKASSRKGALAKAINPDDTDGTIRYKMLAVVCSCSPKLEDILLKLFAQLAEDKEEAYRHIESYGLADFLWEETGKIYGYRSDAPSVQDLLFSMFKSVYDMMSKAGSGTLKKEAIVFMNRWKDSASNRIYFETLSETAYDELNVRYDLEKADFRDLLELDLYCMIDKKILSDIKRGLLSESLGYDDIRTVISQREGTYWYEKSVDLYRGFRYAVDFLELLKRLDMSFSSLQDGFDRYAASYHMMDRYYRKFILHYNRSQETSFLADLYDRIESSYSNVYLMPLNDRWQRYVDSMQDWKIAEVIPQGEFFKEHVESFSDKKIFVVISDALRYESAVELSEVVNREDRYTAEVKQMLGCLPSYTQAGMASLLPHDKLEFSEDFKKILADGKSTLGTMARSHILSSHCKGRGVAILAEEFLRMNSKEEGRELAKNNDVIYIYHNGIDKTGDDRTSESEVFEAVEREFDVLLKVIKKISNVNGNNILVTSDHGFIYQNDPLQESDFAGYDSINGAELTNRRFVLGKHMDEQMSMKKFTASQLGFAGEGDVLIPKSINRLRIQGGGSRFVHGGASLQEVVVPVIEINKKRRSDVSLVNVDVIQTTSRITSRQPTVSLYQSDPTSEKLQGRDIRVGFYSLSGRAISDLQTFAFDSTEQDARNREKKVSFILSSEADDVNHQDIVLRLEEPAGKGTSHYRVYKEFRYSLILSFTSDFDDFD